VFVYKGAHRHGEAPFLLLKILTKIIAPSSFHWLFFRYIACSSHRGNRTLNMIRKYFWLIVFALTVFIFDALIMQWIEFLTTESDKCRNMNSVNPLKLVDCAELD